MRIHKLRRLTVWKPTKSISTYNYDTINNRKWLSLGGFNNNRENTDFRLMTYNILADAYMKLIDEKIAENLNMSKRIKVILK